MYAMPLSGPRRQLYDCGQEIWKWLKMAAKLSSFEHFSINVSLHFFLWHTFWVINVKVFVAVYVLLLPPAALSGVAFIINFMQKVLVLVPSFFWDWFFPLLMLAGRQSGRQHHLQNDK